MAQFSRQIIIGKFTSLLRGLFKTTITRIKDLFKTIISTINTRTTETIFLSLFVISIGIAIWLFVRQQYIQAVIFAVFAFSLIILLGYTSKWFEGVGLKAYKKRGTTTEIATSDRRISRSEEDQPKKLSGTGNNCSLSHSLCSLQLHGSTLYKHRTVLMLATNSNR